MKEHPDYKYRPRRKPKTIVKSPTPTQTQNSAKDSPPQNQNKHIFSSQFDLGLGMPPRPPTFPLAPYPPIDPAFAFDLQARLHAMYYQSWRNTYNPFTPTENSPSPPTLLYPCIKKSTSPSTTPVPSSPTANII